MKEPLQIGFHLSATVSNGSPGSGKPSHSTSVTFDRKKIVSVQCSCGSSAEWCCHLVALCLHRYIIFMLLKKDNFIKKKLYDKISRY